MRYLLLSKDTVWLEFRCERNEYLEVKAYKEACPHTRIDRQRKES